MCSKTLPFAVSPAPPFCRERGSARSGTQAVERALALLDIIASFGGRGMSLREIALRARLDPGTTRRLLLALIRHGFVTQDEASRQYYLGLGLFSAAAAAANRFDVDDRRRDTLRHLSQRAGMAAFFLRDGADVICIDMVQGPERHSPIEIGARRPIGAEAFGLALLASLPDEEGENIVIGNVRRYSRTPEEAIRRVGERMREARRLGYALEIDSMSERWALAVAVTNREGRAEGAMGVALLATPPSDMAPIAQTVLSIAQQFQHEMWRSPLGLQHVAPIASPFDELDLSQCETSLCA